MSKATVAAAPDGAAAEADRPGTAVGGPRPLNRAQSAKTVVTGPAFMSHAEAAAAATAAAEAAVAAQVPSRPLLAPRPGLHLPSLRSPFPSIVGSEWFVRLCSNRSPGSSR
jgi:hypothetical protein